MTMIEQWRLFICHLGSKTTHDRYVCYVWIPPLLIVMDGGLSPPMSHISLCSLFFPNLTQYHFWLVFLVTKFMGRFLEDRVLTSSSSHVSLRFACLSWTFCLPPKIKIKIFCLFARVTCINGQRNKNQFQLL